MSSLQLTQLIGRISARIGARFSNLQITSQLNKMHGMMPRFHTFARLSAISTGTIVAGSGLLSFAFAQGQHGRKPDQQMGREWITNRVAGDICHLAPGLSELMLDILDLLQDRYDKYVNSMRRRISDLESNLKKYGSTISLDQIGEENFALTEPGSSEIQQFKREYRSTYQRSTDMLSGLDRFLQSAGQLGENSCIDKCQREMKEICGLLDELERKVHGYENRLSMAEKHFRTKLRRTNPLGQPTLPR